MWVADEGGQPTEAVLAQTIQCYPAGRNREGAPGCIQHFAAGIG